MKTIKYLFLAFAAAFVLAGCSDDPTYTPGEPDVENGYGVYFPSQENAGDKEFDPTDPTTLQLTAMRTSDTGAITVPVEITGSEAGVFTATEISFPEGATETNFVVSFPNAEIGKTYTCNIRITDKQYASIYGEKPAGVDFSITRVKWNLLVGKGGETKGKWRDDIVSSAFGIPGKFAEVEIEIFERDDKKGYYRMNNVYGPELVAKFFGATPGEVVENCKPATIYIDATKPASVTMAAQELGCTLGSDGWILGRSSAAGTLQDGVITFPKNGLNVGFTVTNAGKWYNGNTSGMHRIMLPGVKEYDYSLVLTKSEPAGGKVNIGAKLGADVTKVKYVFFEGSFSATQAAAKSGDMVAGVIEDKDQEEITATGTIVAEMEKTGIYTIVANIYNAAGEFKGYQYLPFGYIAAGEEKPVILTYGLDITNEHAAEGFTKENSVKVYANGQQITAGYYGVFETSKIAVGANLETLVKKSGKAFTADQLAKINGNGFAAMVGNLASGTPYKLIIWANNGYIGKVFTADAKTDGIPHPLRSDYTLSDLADNQLSKSDLSKTWNYYAVDAYAEPATTIRAKVGTVTITDNTTNDITGSADPSNDADFMDITGISGIPSAQLGGKSDKMLIEYVDGLLASVSGQYIGKFQNTYFIKNLMTCVENTKAYTANWALIGGIVEEGYIAFVANPNYFAQGITFKGMVFLAYKDPEMTTSAGGITSYYNMMLVDPTVDAANPASTSQMPRISRQNLVNISNACADPTNFVEKRGKDRLRALIQEFTNKPDNKASGVTEVTPTVLGAAKAKVTFTKGIAETPMTGSLLSIGILADIEVK